MELVINNESNFCVGNNIKITNETINLLINYYLPLVGWKTILIFFVINNLKKGISNKFKFVNLMKTVNLNSKALSDRIRLLESFKLIKTYWIETTVNKNFYQFYIHEPNDVETLSADVFFRKHLLKKGIKLVEKDLTKNEKIIKKVEVTNNFFEYEKSKEKVINEVRIIERKKISDRIIERLLKKYPNLDINVQNFTTNNWIKAFDLAHNAYGLTIIEIVKILNQVNIASGIYKSDLFVNSVINRLNGEKQTKESYLKLKFYPNIEKVKNEIQAIANTKQQLKNMISLLNITSYDLIRKYNKEVEISYLNKLNSLIIELDFPIEYLNFVIDYCSKMTLDRKVPLNYLKKVIVEANKREIKSISELIEWLKKSYKSKFDY